MYDPVSYKGENHWRDDELGVQLSDIRKKIGSMGSPGLLLMPTQQEVTNLRYAGERHFVGLLTSNFPTPADFFMLPFRSVFFTFVLPMQPDYPGKIFNDKRSSFILLMQTLAMQSPYFGY